MDDDDELFLLEKSSATRTKRIVKIIQGMSGLRAYYPLNETSGTTAYNRALTTKGQFNGVNSGAALNYPGKIGKGYKFDGVSNMITTTLDTSNTAFSIYFVFSSPFTTSADNVRGIFNKRENHNEWRITTTNAGVLNFTGWSDDVTTAKTTNSATLTANKLYGVAITYDGTTLTMYVSGLANVSSSSGAAIQDTAATVFFGRESNDVDRYFDGVLQHVAFFNRVITAIEVARLQRLTGF